jgi:uncharacterized membrane protein YgaE (UPF0421/DUF939 family)
MAAVASLLVARVCRLPESYWAVITTLVVMQSTVGAAFLISTRRLAGTALGAALGAMLATYFGPNVLAFGAGLFLLGPICAALGRAYRPLQEHLDRTAYRFAGITLAITMLIVRPRAAWVVAVHRFIEVSIGIAVGLIVTVLWPERRDTSVQT